MSDYLVNLGTKPSARKLVGMLGMPLPQKLRRAKGPWQERPLHDRTIAVGHGSDGTLAEVLAGAITAAGADCFVTGDDAMLPPYVEHGAAHGRHPTQLQLDDKPDGFRPHGIIFDGTGLTHPEQLREAWAFFQPLARGLRKCGRALVIARTPALDDVQAAATSRGLEGFARSLARELGRKGSTAQLVFVEQGAEDRLPPLVRFLLTERPAFVSGQPITVTGQVTAPACVPSTRPLDGKVAIVTGAAHGIGTAEARLLAQEGARVIVMDRPSEEEHAERVADAIGGTPLLVDITDQGAPDAIAAMIDERFDGRLDVLVHNAGVTRDKMLFNMGQEHWDMVLDVNLLSVLRVNERLLPMMSAGGRVVLTSSIGGIAGNNGQCNYAASKAGIIGLTQALAPAQAARGVAVNAVAPGFVETRMTARMPAATREVARRISSLSQGALPQDIAEVVTFLASPGAAGLCGNVIRVCGGNLMGA
jgi:3-oxoacyl-[acyl-carrier protein] reductase